MGYFQLALIPSECDISDEYLETWPRAGMTLVGESSAPPKPAHPTSATASGSLGVERTAETLVYKVPQWEKRLTEIPFGLLPTPAAREPGWRVGGTVEVVDKDGQLPAHFNQRFYDRHTGRIVQKGLGQIAEMFPTPVVPNGGRMHNLDNVRLEGKTLLRKDGSKAQMDLETYTRMWPTPSTENYKSDGANALHHYTENAKNGTPVPTSYQRLRNKVMFEEAQAADGDAVDFWPTPKSRDFRVEYHTEGILKRESPDLNKLLGGKLNADWVEWLMNWPVGWTSLEPMPEGNFDAWLQEGWWDREPADVPRLTGGAKDRVSRIKALGNGQVPHCAAAAWMLLTEGEEWQ